MALFVFMVHKYAMQTFEFIRALQHPWEDVLIDQAFESSRVLFVAAVMRVFENFRKRDGFVV